MQIPSWVPVIVVPTITTTFAAWLTDNLPKKGLPREENERRVRSIAASVVASVAATGLAYMQKPTTAPTAAKAVGYDLVRVD